MNKFIFYVIIGVAVLTVGTGLLTPPIMLLLQPVGNFEFFEVEECSCTGRQCLLLNFTDHICKNVSMNLLNETSEEILSDSSSSIPLDIEGLGAVVWKSSLQENSSVNCEWPEGYLPEHKFEDSAYFYSDILIQTGTPNSTESSSSTVSLMSLPSDTITEDDPTLLQALDARGDGVNMLAKESVAALLNAADENVRYPYSVSDVIALTQKAIAEEDYDIAEEFHIYNSLNRPLELCK